jgi:hypothetical protein
MLFSGASITIFHEFAREIGPKKVKNAKYDMITLIFSVESNVRRL